MIEGLHLNSVERPDLIDEAARSAGVTPEQAAQVLEVAEEARAAEETRAEDALKNAKDALATRGGSRRTGLFAVPSVRHLRGQF